MHHLPEDILLINKPKGITSFDVIRQLQRKIGIKKIGHAGTLDPLAHGLMIVGIATGTKKLNGYLKLPKVYIADILLGEKRTTGDMEGEIIEERDIIASEFREYDIEQKLQTLIGKHNLQVPIYSAIKLRGRPLYKYARNGEIPRDIPIKEMEIFAISLLDHFARGNRYMLKVRIEVSSGSYIRTIAEEIGKLFNSPAVLADLLRTKIGEYSIEDAKNVADIVWYNK